MWIPDPLYTKIKKKLPIPCVDLIVKNKADEILLVKRANQPAKGEWWFPGGRINHGESRIDAAERKLKEECGLNGVSFKEWKTIDIFLFDQDEDYLSHGISSLYIVEIIEYNVHLDGQSLDHNWKIIEDWVKNLKESLLKNTLREFMVK